ncbi:MAG: Wzz/FepE/Etk N-terminal domain-containing protein [Pseudomonadota bacterium]
MQDLTFFLTYILHELWKRRWSILAVAYATAAIGIAAVLLLPDRYTSRSVIFVDTQSLLTRVLNQRASLLDPTAQVEQMRRLMYTDTNIRTLIRRSDLDHQVRSTADEERLIEKLRTEVLLERDNDNTYSVTYTHTSPDTAQQVVSNLVNLFIERNLNRIAIGSEESIEFLERNLSTVEDRIATIDREIADFQRENVGDLSTMATLSSRLDAMTVEARQLKLEETFITARLDTARAQLASTPERIQQGFVQGLPATSGGADLDTLLAQRAALLSRVTEAHPDVRAIDAQIAVARTQGNRGGGGGRAIFAPNPLRAQLRSQVDQLEVEQAVNKQNQTELRERTARLQDQMARQPEILQRLDALTGERTRLLDRAEVIRADIEKADLTTKVSREGYVELEIVEPAVAPVRPSGPPRGLILIAVLIASFAIGAASAVVRIQLADNMPTLIHLRAAFDLPILGSISRIHPTGHRQRAFASFIAFAIATTALIAAVGYLYFLFEHRDWRPDFTPVKQTVQAELGVR